MNLPLLSKVYSESKSSIFGDYDGSHTLVLNYSVIREKTMENPWESELFIVGDVGWKLKCFRMDDNLYFSLMGVSDVTKSFIRPSHIRMTLKKQNGWNKYVCTCFIGSMEAVDMHSLVIFENPSLVVIDDCIIYKIETKVINKTENDHCFHSLGINIKSCNK